MKLIKFLAFALLFNTFGYAQKLTIVQQDYTKALTIAKKENKLLLIDFYTTWCKPCKELDELVLNKKSIKKILAKDFVLLKYNAEDDKVYHLSKKYHIVSYPTGLIVNKEGYVVKQGYGFSGNDSKSLSASFLKFTNEAKELHNKSKFIKGYTNTIDISIYPKFYIDYKNRDNLKVDKVAFNNYWKKEQNVLSEGYFTTLLNFAIEVPNYIADASLKNRYKYIELYGKKDTDVLFFLLSSSKFDAAISNKSKKELDNAIAFIKKTLDKEWANNVISYYQKSFSTAQKKG